MQRLNLFIPITKIDAQKRLVYGTLTEEVPDKSGEIIDYDSTKAAYQKWSSEAEERSQGKSKGNLRAMHSNIAAGKFTDITFDDENKRIEGVAKVVDDDEWNKVVEGVYAGFSHGGDYAKRWKDPTNPHLTRYTPELAEVSLVDNPCCPTATFEFIKEDGAVELRKFNSPKEELTIMDTQDNAPAAAAEDRPQNKGGVEQVWKAKDGSTHMTKADALKRNDEIDAEAEAAPVLEALAKMDAALTKGEKKGESEDDEDEKAKKAKDKDDADKAKKAEDEADGEKSKKADGEDEDADKSKKAKKEDDDKKADDAADKAHKADAEDEAEKGKKAKDGKDEDGKKAKKAADADALAKKDYSDKEREKMADSGEAMEDGSFPIKTKKDLENAIQAYGRAKDKAKAKAHIIERAKALGAEDELPDDWKEKGDKAATGDLQKGMHGVAHLAHLLESIDCLLDASSVEAAVEGDDSDMPDKLEEWLKEGASLLRDMVAEETAELAAGDDDDAAVLAMSAAVRGLSEAGARHGKADMERVQKMHDDAHEMHKCMGDMVDKCADMHKGLAAMKNTAIDLGAEGEKADEQDDGKADKAVAVGLTKMTAENAALRKVLTDLTPKMEAMLKRVEAQNDRIDHLERQPMPAKGAVRAVEKGASAPSDEDVLKKFTGMSKADQDMLLMKAALSSPSQIME